MHKKILILFLFLFLSLSLVNAQPPFQQEAGSVEGLTLRFPPIIHLKINTTISAHMHVYNSTNGLLLTNSSVDCFAHIYNSTGDHVLEQEMNFDLNTVDFELIILYGNFTERGQQSFIIWCNSTTAGGFVSGALTVTENGLELTEAENSLFTGGMFLLVIFLIGSLVCLYKFEHYIAKFVFYWISHLLIILISFSVWQFTDGYALGYVGIAGIFKIIFYFFSIAVFPMVLVSIAWIVYIHTFNDHFQKLVDKGEDPETAFAITKRRKKRW